MKKTATLCCLLLAITASLFTIAKAQVNANDSLALVDLYNGTDGPNWYTHTNWLTTAPVSTWYGVKVTNNRVTILSLIGNGLTGSIPASVGNLVNLTSLDFTYNYLSGSIPGSISNLVNLTSLLLDGNQLSGTIPASINNCVNLIVLNLKYNKLSGTIPTGMGSLAKLTSLYLNNNQLSGAIPAEIGNLKKLNLLYLNNNRLNGAIPAEIGNLARLTFLYLNNNQLSGTIPAKLGKLEQLYWLYLNNNQLSGSVPFSLTNLERLSGFNLSHNLLTQFEEKHSSLTTYQTEGNLNNNLFTFEGLQVIAKHYPYWVTYAPQNTILPIHQNGNTLSVYAGGTLSNNTYHWFKAGSTDSTLIAGDSTFAPSESGSYYVQVTNSIATRLTLHSDTINFVMPVARQSNTLIAKAAQPSNVIKQMLVYPNPATNIIHLQTNGTAVIAITNSNGKVLLTKTINNSDVINVGKYANGVYYIKNTTTGETQKIVVVH